MNLRTDKIGSSFPDEIGYVVMIENALKDYFEVSPIGFALLKNTDDQKKFTEQYHFVEVNPAFEKITGFKKKSILGKAAAQVFSADNATHSGLRQLFEAIILTKGNEIFAHEFHETGQQFIVHVTALDATQLTITFTEIKASAQIEKSAGRMCGVANAAFDAVNGEQLKPVQSSNFNADFSILEQHAILNQLNSFSLELAYLPSDQVFPCIVSSIKTIFGLKAAWLSTYDAATSELVVQYSSLSEAENSKVIKILGGELLQRRILLQEHDYERMITETYAIISSLNELTFGTVPDLVGKALKKLLGIDWFAALALIHGEKLVGTMVLVGHKNQPYPEKSIISTFAGIAANAISRKEAQEALVNSEEISRLVLELAPDAFFRGDHSGNLIGVNTKATELLGYTKDELLGMNIKDLFPVNVLQVKPLRYDLLQSGETIIIEREIRRKNGETIRIEMNSRAMPDGTYQSFFRDVTGRYRTEKLLREEKEHHAEVIANISDVLWEYEIDPNGRLVRSYISPVVDGMLGLPAETIGHSFEAYYQFIHPDDLQPALKTLKTSIFSDEKRIHRVEYRIITAEGEIKHVRSSGIVKVKSDGNRLAYGITSDITELKQKEAELLRTKANTTAIFENTTDNIWAINTSYEITYLNENFKQAFRSVFNVDLQPGSNKLTALPESLIPIWKERYDRVFRGERLNFTDTITLPGSTTSIEVVANPIQQDGIIIGASFFGRDITAKLQTEAEVRKLAEVSAASNDYIVIIGDDFCYRYANDVYLKAKKLQLEEIIGRHMVEIVGKQRFEELGRPQVEAALRGDTVEEVEFTDFGQNDPHYLHVRVTPYRENDGLITGVVMTGRDITEIKQAEEKIRNSERAFAEINDCLVNLSPNYLENINTLTALCGRLLGATCALYNRLEGDMLCSLGQWSLPADYNLVDTAQGHICYDVIRQGKQQVFLVRNLPETAYYTSDPNVKRFNLMTYAGHAVYSGTEALGSLCVVYQKDIVLSSGDISIMSVIASALASEELRFLSHQAIEESNRKYQGLSTLLRLLADNMPDMLWAKNLQCEYIFANKAMCEKLLHATDTEEPLGKTDMFFAKRERDSRPDNPEWHTFGEICRDTDSVTLEAGSPMQFDEYGNVRGNFLFLDVHKAPLYDDKGECIGVVGSARDVTIARNVESQLRKLSLAVKQSPASVLITSPEGIIEYVNPKFTEVTGYLADEAIGRNPRILKSGGQTGEVYAQLWKTISSGKEWKGELLNKKKNGCLFWESVLISPIKGDNDEVMHFLAVKEDITESKLHAEKIRITKDTYESILNSVNESIYVQDENGYFIDVNLGAEKMYGYTRAELLGKGPADVTAPGKNDLDYVKNVFLEVSRTGIPRTIEFWGRRKNGEVFPKEVIMNRGKYFGKDHVIATARDISERKRTETAQKIQFNIARSIHTVQNQAELLETIRQELNQLFDTTNFFVARYNPDKNSFKQLIFCDEMDNFDEWDADQSISGRIVQTGKTIFLRGDELDQFCLKNNLEALGTDSACWLGVPVVVHSQVRGVMVIQHYTNPHAYTDADVTLFEMIAHETGIYLEKQIMVEDLIRAKEKAEESDHLKSAFLANMSHEIRTPMNGILGFLEILNEPDLTNESREHYISIVKKSGKRLLDTINDIIEISKIEAGQLPVKLSEISIHDVLSDHVKFFRKEAEAKGLTLSVHDSASARISSVTTDRHKLDGILTNLIKNAIKFTSKGSITVTAAVKNNELIFSVKDTGIGIPADRVHAIFERFVQADLLAYNRPYEGSGLGLPIVKAYLDLLKGSIWVESVPGVGSTFNFTLPVVLPECLPQIIPPNVQPNSTVFADLSVLIAEDDDTSYNLLRIFLEKLGVKFQRAKNGEEAVTFATKKDFDLIFMDIKMPVMNGLEATKAIRTLGNNIHIIALTAFALSGDRERALDAGCNDYVAKPLSFSDLVEALHRYIGSPE